MADTANTTVSELIIEPVFKKSRFDINRFHAEIRNNSILTNNRFLVQFQPFYADSKVSSELNFLFENRDRLTMRCENISLPGPKLLTNNNIRRYGYGPVEYMPHDVQFSNVSLSWIVDSNAEILEFFDKWMNAIINHESKGGSAMNEAKTYEGSAPVEYMPYNVGYKDDYACSRITIFVYNMELEQVISYDLYDAFPISVSDTPMDWNNKGSHMKFTVSFAYTDIRVRRPTDPLLEFNNAFKESINPLVESGSNLANRTTNTLINGVTKLIRGS